ncbi:hypothetical protein D018_4490B, partial [Vibrio parahaemolyticus VP2007-007]
SPGPNFK